MHNLDFFLTYFVIFVALGSLVIGTRAIPYITQGPRLRAWQHFAERTGLRYLPGDLFAGRKADDPKVSGDYRGRKIIIAAHTHGRWSYLDAQTEVVLSVRNTITPKFPRGGVFQLRKCWLGKAYFREQRYDQLQLLFQRGYETTSAPESLGNSLRRMTALRQVSHYPGFLQLFIKDQHLHFIKRNIDREAEKMLQLVDLLCEVAEGFERYGVWLK